MANVSGTDVEKKLESKHVTTLKDWFEQDNFKTKILAALPKVINRDAFIINAYNIYANNPKLQKCTLSSFLDSLMQSAKVGLMPNTPLGHCFILPYYNTEKGVYEAQFQMGYPGHIELALRTNKYKTIYAHEVYPKDTFRRTYGLHKDLIHVPSEEPDRKKDKPKYYYAVYKLFNGGEDFECWTRDEILQHRDKYSPSYKKAKNKELNTWVTSEDAMALKTMIVRVLRWAPKSTEMVYALSTEPGEEARRNMFPEYEMDITPSVQELPVEEPIDDSSEEEKPKPKAEPEEPIADDAPEPAPNNLESIEVMAREAGYDTWKAIIIEGCRTKGMDGKPVFDASVTEKEAKEILVTDKEKHSVLYHHFNILVDKKNAGKG